MHVDSEGTDDFGAIIEHAADGATTSEAGLYVEAEAGAGAFYVHRNVGAATTGTLVAMNRSSPLIVKSPPMVALVPVVTTPSASMVNGVASLD